jgi:hypothetical protein
LETSEPFSVPEESVPSLKENTHKKNAEETLREQGEEPEVFTFVSLNMAFEHQNHLVK